MRRRVRTPRTALVLFAGAVAVFVVLALLAAVLIRLAPQWLTDTEGRSRVERDEARGRARTALFAMLAGLIALAGAIYTARSFALNRRGQITERFTRAIDQLGDEKIELRLGGIYALERIAHESRDEHGPILEVLTAYVRENSPWPPRQPPTRAATDPAHPANHPLDDDERAPQRIDTPPEASVDIKAILTVLSRRELRHEHETRGRLDLAKTNLRGVRAPRIDLRDAHLRGAQLQDAILWGAQLQHAFLGGAQLQHAFLGGAQLQGAEFTGAQLQGAELTDAQLQDAFLTDAQLQDANLMGAQLQGANLTGAQLQGAYLVGASCDSATIWPHGFAWRDARVQLETE
jgi:hypothetical protein